VGQARHLGEDIHRAGEVLGPAWAAVDRLDNHQGTPDRQRWKRGAQQQAIGRSVGGRTTKIHLVTDAEGRPRVIQLTPGNTNDHKPARHCLEQMPTARYVIADKGYDSAPLRHWLDQLGCQAVIPPRRNRKVLYHYDASLYRERNIIERTINRFKDWRRIATRFDRYAFIFLAALSIVAILTWWV
jgi:transposase